MITGNICRLYINLELKASVPKWSADILSGQTGIGAFEDIRTSTRSDRCKLAGKVGLNTEELEHYEMKSRREAVSQGHFHPRLMLQWLTQLILSIFLLLLTDICSSLTLAYFCLGQLVYISTELEEGEFWKRKVIFPSKSELLR